jgi:hypothetical protein
MRADDANTYSNWNCSPKSVAYTIRHDSANTDSPSDTDAYTEWNCATKPDAYSV